MCTVGGAFTYLAVNSERDIPGFIDDERVLETATRECRLMTSTVKGLLADGGSEDWIDTLSDQNTAVRNMVARIRSLESKLRESDQPLDAWLADWEKLVSGREAYLGQRRRGADIDFRVPRSPDGDPINERMDMAAEDVCPVPEVLLQPDLAGTTSV